MKKSNHHKRKICFLKVLVILCFFGAFYCAGETAFAASSTIDRDSISSDCVGKMYSQTENGLAVTGIGLWVNNRKVAYAYDVWQYTQAAGWEFQYANLCGLYTEEQGYLVNKKNDYVRFTTTQGSNCRVYFYSQVLKNNLRKYSDCSVDNYMVETIFYQKGEEIGREYEYSTDSSGWMSSDKSLMVTMENGNYFSTGACTPEETSVEFYVHTGISIGEGKTVNTHATTGVAIEGVGEAYEKVYNKASGQYQYQITSLPTATKERDKNEYVFDGWYTSEDGGDKVSVGDLILYNTELYPHWKETKKPCEVTCIDVLKTDNRSVVLGSTTWEGEYGEMAYGSQAGDSTQTGMYYEGIEYTDSSSMMIQAEGTTVYRYFKNSDMTVTCIDTVTLGPDTGQQLGATLWEAEYSTIASGGALGCDKEVGAYYKGYRYMYSSSQKVASNGCTVYRYFAPITYNIEFVSGTDSGGVMSVMSNCYYGHSYQLTSNSFVNKHTISLNLNGEGAVCDTTSQSVFLEFAGWSLSEGGGVLLSDGATINSLCDTEDTVKLYAVWSDKDITLEAQPKRSGYEFCGWSESETATTGKRQFQVKGDMQLYAVWQAALVSYHVEYYKQNLNQTYDRAAQYDFVAYTDTLAVIDPPEDLYTGFDTDKESSRLEGTVKADGSLILTAYFKRKSVTVDYDFNGGTLVSDGEAPESVTSLFEQTIPLPEVSLERNGYLFGGWSESRNGKVISLTTDGEYTMPAHDQTLYACWIPKTDTSYTLVPYYENIDGKGYTAGEKVQLQGTTDSVVMTNLLTQASSDTADELLATLFGGGFTLSQTEDLENTTISSEGDTEVELYFVRKKYVLQFLLEQKENQIVAATREAIYGQSFVMPETMQDIEDISCYQDFSGNSYYPGDTVTVLGGQAFLIRKNETPQDATDSSDNPSAVTTTKTPGSGTPQPDESTGTTGSTASSSPQDSSQDGTVTGDADASGGTNPTGGTSASGSADTHGGTSSSGSADTAGEISASGSTDTAGGTSASGSTNPTGGTSASGRADTPGGTTSSGSTDTAGEISASGSADTAGEISASGSTDTPGGTGTSGSTSTPGSTNKPVVTNKPNTVVTALPSASDVSQSSVAPQTTTTPTPETATDKSNTVSTTAAPEGELSIISTWIGADSEKIASKLAQSTEASRLKKGSTFQKKGICYRVLKSSTSKRTVCVTGTTKDKKVLRIPAEVVVNGTSYQVVKIQKKAIVNKKKCKKIVIGKNVTAIGKKGLANNSNLQTLVIQAKNLSKIERGAWSGCSRSLRIKFEKSCSEACKKYVTKKNKTMS